MFSLASFQDFFSNHTDWIITKPIRVILILIVAFILARLVRRATRKLAERIARGASGEPAEDLEQGQGERLDKESAEQVEDWSFASRGFAAVRGLGVKALPASERSVRAAQRADTLGHALSSVASVVIYVIAGMLCLSELEVNLGPLLAGAGIVGVAVGFGAQSLVRDFLSGMFILIEDQYGLGDIVDVGETTGLIEGVTLRSTKLRSLDGTLWHVPNGEIRRSGNKSQYWARILLDVPVPYEADLVAASTLIKEVADGVWSGDLSSEVIEEPEVWGVEDFGPDSLAVRLVVKTTPGSQWTVAREIRGRLKEAFDQAGIEIPFPQRTVWIRNASGNP
ncbi:MAG: mechanosensitive ion channel family protein [bacterium]